MNKISKLNSKILQEKLNPQSFENKLKSGIKAQKNDLERTPKSDYFDFSLEESGILMQKDAEGNVLKVIKTIFPR